MTSNPSHNLSLRLGARPFLIALALCALTGVLLCFLPLFEIIGYESGAAVGVVCGVCAALLTTGLFPLGGRGPLEVRGDGPLLFIRAFGRHLLLALPPLLFLGLNLFRVPACDVAMGVGFWILIVPFSILMGQAVGWAASAARGRMGRLVWVLVLLGGNGVAFGLHIALHPPIRGHQWLIGYFSGSIYDEALTLPPSLLWYRITGVFLVGALVWGAEWIRRGRTSRRLAALALSCLVVWVGATALEEEMGVRISRDTIAEKLGGVTETEHFVIHFPLTTATMTQLDLLEQDHEFRYAEMKDFFGTDPVALHGEKIHSFVYPDNEVKGRLMGARRTLIAKIWLREMHITWAGYGHHLLAHELAHIFTEPFAAGPLRLSMQHGIGANMGLVEGVATAADWPADELTPHEAAQAMRLLGIAPDIRGLVGASGFWTQASGKAYTLMGSFVRFLIEVHGIDRFKQVYSGGDFLGVYGLPADRLVKEWEDFLEGIEVGEREMELARYRYTRPSIFGKVCARAVAELRRKAELAAAAGDVERARTYFDEILSYDPENIAYRLAQAKLLAWAQDVGGASEAIDQLLEDAPSDLSPSLLAAALHTKADLAWRSDDHTEAASLYTECEMLGVGDDTMRALVVKRRSLSLPPPSRALARRYLLESPPEATLLYYPMAWRVHDPSDALAAYLVGRKLWIEGEWEHAASVLEESATYGLDEPILSMELMYMRATTAYHLGDDATAHTLFTNLAEEGSSRLQTLSMEWLARLSWRASLSR